MYLRVPKLLSPDQVAEINKTMNSAPYVDGKETGGAGVQSLKNNLQLDRQGSREPLEIDTMLLECLWSNAVVRSALLPCDILAPHYVRYGKGMSYGAHVDNPVMGVNPGVRTDASITVFLNDPSDYQGGELVVKSEVGDVSFKLPAGEAVIYPTGAIHGVNPVTDGERRVAVTWVQSLIPDPAQRRIIYEMDIVCQSLFKKLPDSEEYRILMRTYGNLVRMWGRP